MKSWVRRAAVLLVQLLVAVHAVDMKIVCEMAAAPRYPIQC